MKPSNSTLRLGSPYLYFDGTRCFSSSSQLRTMVIGSLMFSSADFPIRNRRPSAGDQPIESSSSGWLLRLPHTETEDQIGRISRMIVDYFEGTQKF
jgi:hypothetical protein